MPTISTLTVDVKTDTSKLKSGARQAGVAFAALAAGAVVAFHAFEETQQVAAQTDAVLKSTGGSANVTAQQVSDLANAIKEKTGIDDEQIQSGENMLLTFTNIRNEVGKGNDIFNQATVATTDMAAAMAAASGGSIDLKGASIQLGKALNDPVKGITALTRVGVSFDQQTQDQIKSLVAHGKTLEAQKIILGEVTKEFGGSAVAQKTASKTAATAFGDLEEALGGVVAGGIGPLLSAAQPVIAFLTKFPGLTAAIIGGIVAVYAATKLWAVGLEAIRIAQLLIAATNPFLLIALAVGVLAVIIIKNWGTIKRVVLKVWDAIKNSAPFKVIAAVVGVYVKIIVTYIKTILAIAQAVWNGIKVVATTAFKVIAAEFRIEFNIIKTVFNAVKTALITGWKAIKDVGTGIWSAISGAAISVFNAIAGAWNRTVGALSFHVPSWVPGIGGNGFDVPDIPTFAMGGVMPHTGLALVHKGETITPAGGGFGNVTVNVYGSVMTERDLATSIQKTLLKDKRRSGALGLA